MEQATKQYHFVDDTMKEFDGGVFVDKLNAMMQDVALGVAEYDKQGEVIVKMTLKRIKNTSQVMVQHSLAFKRPTMHGKSAEESITATALYVGKGGKLTIMPDSQTGFDFSRE